MKVAAIYARVSSERQKEEQTIASQTAALIRFAQDEGYTVPQEWVFEDEGYSGSRLGRPGLERVRDLASEAQIEAVLVYSPDRLSRKYAYQVLLLEELGRQGVEVHFIQSVQVVIGVDRDQAAHSQFGQRAEHLAPNRPQPKDRHRAASKVSQRCLFVRESQVEISRYFWWLRRVSGGPLVPLHGVLGLVLAKPLKERCLSFKHGHSTLPGSHSRKGSSSRSFPQVRHFFTLSKQPSLSCSETISGWLSEVS